MRTIDDVYQALKKLKIKEKFIIIHSDVVGLQFNNFSISKLWEIIFDAIGDDKTYLFPTFCFSNSKVWDYYKTPSDCGILSEYFRKNISLKRTIHPIHSLSIYGKNFLDIPDHDCASSFGQGSVWDWLCNNKDVCNLSLGVNLQGGATICHYSEEHVGVNYRNYLPIKKIILGKNNEKILSNFSYYARIENKNYYGSNNWTSCQNDLLKNKIMKRMHFFKKQYPISIMNAFQATQFIINKIKSNPNYIGKLYNK